VVREFERTQQKLDRTTILVTRRTSGCCSSGRITSPLQRDPMLTEAMTRAFMFADRAQQPKVNTVARLMERTLTQAIHEGEPTPTRWPSPHHRRRLAVDLSLGDPARVGDDVSSHSSCGPAAAALSAPGPALGRQTGAHTRAVTPGRSDQGARPGSAQESVQERIAEHRCGS